MGKKNKKKSRKSSKKTLDSTLDLREYCIKTHKLNCNILRKNSTKEQWKKDSREAITANDVAGIMGVSIYSSPLKVYLNKVLKSEEIESDEIKLNEEMKDFICNKFVKSNNDIKVLKIKDTLKSKYDSFAVTKIDRRLIQNGKCGVLHVKIASQYTKEAWEGEFIPMEYYLKIQWSLMVTGCSFGYYAVIVGGNTYIQRRIERSEETIRMLKSTCKSFYENYLLKKRLPNIDGEKTTAVALDKLYKREDTEITLGEDAEALIKKRDRLKVEAKELMEYIQECENKLKAEMKNNKVAIVKDKKIIWRSLTKNTLDSKGLKKDYPEIYKKYLKETSYTRFEIRDNNIIKK